MPPRDDTAALALAFRQSAAPPDPEGEDATLALAAAFQARSQGGELQPDSWSKGRAPVLLASALPVGAVQPFKPDAPVEHKAAPTRPAPKREPPKASRPKPDPPKPATPVAGKARPVQPSTPPSSKEAVKGATARAGKPAPAPAPVPETGQPLPPVAPPAFWVRRATAGAAAAPAGNPYARLGAMFQAEAGLPPAERELLGKARAGEALTTQRRQLDRTREKVAKQAASAKPPADAPQLQEYLRRKEREQRQEQWLHQDPARLAQAAPIGTALGLLEQEIQRNQQHGKSAPEALADLRGYRDELQDRQAFARERGLAGKAVSQSPQGFLRFAHPQVEQQFRHWQAERHGWTVRVGDPGEEPNRYAEFAPVFAAERQLPAADRQVLEKERSGKTLTPAEKQQLERARERLAATLGQPYSPPELRRRALFGPGSINPRTLEEAGQPPPFGRVESAAEGTFYPTLHQRKAESYEVYRDQAARGEVAPPPTFSLRPEERSLQEADLRKIREWVWVHAPPMPARAALLDFRKEADRKNPWAVVRERLGRNYAYLESLQASNDLGVQTQFGRQLLKAVAAERRSHIPYAMSEARRGGMDHTVLLLATGLGAAAGAATEGAVAGIPLLGRLLGPAARAAPPLVESMVEGGIQQAGTAYAGGERRPGELLINFLTGGGVGVGTGYGVGLGTQLAGRGLRQASRRLIPYGAALDLELSTPHGGKPSGGALRLDAKRAAQAAAKDELKQAGLEFFNKPRVMLQSSAGVPDPQMVLDALPVARALVKYGAATTEHLTEQLKQHLRGRTEEFSTRRWCARSPRKRREGRRG